MGEENRGWRRWIPVGLAAWAAAGAGAAWAEERTGEPKTGTLVVVARGIESPDGEVLIQLASSRADYESDDAGFRTAKLAAAPGAVRHRFEQLPYGEYAIKLFHDENSNLELDVGWTGPEERYGFSNGARGTFGPPDWDEARFTFDQPEQTVSIEVK